MTAFVVLLVLAGLYLYSSWRWPFTVCTRCKGKPKDRSPSKKHWDDCKRCGGSGKRVRFGAQLLGRSNSRR